MSKTEAHKILRVLKLLTKAPALYEENPNNHYSLLNTESYGTIRCENLIVEQLKLSGAVAKDTDGLVQITARGKTLLQQLGAKPDKSDRQIHQPGASLECQTIDQSSVAPTVLVNLSESPLAMLYRLNKMTGQRFLSDEEFQAGERLRADFTRGNMTPRVTANWEAVITKRHRGERGGIAELSDHALDCRDRVHKALSAVGPELSGVLLDICCFLKGLEIVERERAWPVRSAKMLLKTGLSILHRHYHPEYPGQKHHALRHYHWGDTDYRPSI